MLVIQPRSDLHHMDKMSAKNLTVSSSHHRRGRRRRHRRSGGGGGRRTRRRKNTNFGFQADNVGMPPRRFRRRKRGRKGRFGRRAKH